MNIIFNIAPEIKKRKEKRNSNFDLSFKVKRTRQSNCKISVEPGRSIYMYAIFYFMITLF